MGYFLEKIFKGENAMGYFSKGSSLKGFATLIELASVTVGLFLSKGAFEDEDTILAGLIALMTTVLIGFFLGEGIRALGEIVDNTHETAENTKNILYELKKQNKNQDSITQNSNKSQSVIVKETKPSIVKDAVAIENADIIACPNCGKTQPGNRKLCFKCGIPFVTK